MRAGGSNFDAKLRRESTDVADLFYAHISGIDALARGLRNAARIIEVGSALNTLFLPLVRMSAAGKKAITVFAGGCFARSCESEVLQLHKGDWQEDPGRQGKFHLSVAVAHSNSSHLSILLVHMDSIPGCELSGCTGWV